MGDYFGGLLKTIKRKSPVNQRLTGLYCGERGIETVQTKVRMQSSASHRSILQGLGCKWHQQVIGFRSKSERSWKSAEYR